MKCHTTNYFNTFIEIADDCGLSVCQIPSSKGENKSLAGLQYDMLNNNPYKYSSDDIFFMIYAKRNNIPDEKHEKAREQFFSKGQPCFRASPLTKKFGFGIHSDGKGKVAMYGCETEQYKDFIIDPSVRKIKAMRSTKIK